MMEEAFIKKNHYLIFISTSLIAINILMISIAVSHIYGFTGSRLQKFQILNATLDSVTTLAVDFVSAEYNKDTDHVIVMELNSLGTDSIDFVYSFYDKKIYISENYLQLNDRRVIGYTNKNSIDIIITTKIQNRWDIWRILSDYIKPTKELKFFSYIYYSNMIAKEWNGGGIYDPWFWHFKYYKGKIYDKYATNH